MSSTLSTLPDPKFTPLRGGATLRWGVLAPGGIARAWVGSLHSNTDQKVAAVASRSLDRAQAFATSHGIERAYGDYAQLVADPGVDAVYIAAPHTEHLALALLAISAGKHVLVEKPIGVSADEARQIKAAAGAAGVFAMEAMWSRFLPQTSIVEQLLADGGLGDVNQVVAHFGALFDYAPDNRWFDPALGGGALLDIGIYPLWLAHFVLGKPDKITANGSLAPTGVDAQSAVVLEHGARAQGIVTMTMWGHTSKSATISGTLGRVEYTGDFMAPSGLRLFDLDKQTAEWIDPSGLVWGEALCYQAAAVAQHVADGLLESPLHPLDDTIEILEVIDEARRQLGAK